jgi:hypothetical protein
MALQHPAIVQDLKIANFISDSINIIPSSFFWKAENDHIYVNFCTYYVAY